MKKGPYEVISSTVVYKNPWIEVREDKLRTDEGHDGLFGTIDYGSGVTVVAVTAKKEVYLVREYYYALEEYGVQLPSGGIDQGETPLEAAKRELKEETGIVAKQWYELGFINPLTMILKSPAHLFLAMDTEEQVQTDHTIIPMKMLFDEAYELMLKNEITHAPSCMALVKAKHLMDQHKIL